jgi:prolyl-tRNA synthetase
MVLSGITQISGRGVCRRSLGVQLRAFSVSRIAQAVSSHSTLSTTWVPTGGLAANDNEFGHGKLIRAGFLRQAHSGIFQLLPLGLRVQDKIEKLIDKHMHSVGSYIVINLAYATKLFIHRRISLVAVDYLVRGTLAKEQSS